MSSVRAIYDKGVFRPIDPVDLPDQSRVIFEPRLVNLDAAPSPAMARVYEVLFRSYDTAAPDLARRHDKHQP